jgi:PAS domain S-box-containing protein
VLFDAGGRTRAVGPELARLLGRPAGELVGLPVADLLPDVPLDPGVPGISGIPGGPAHRGHLAAADGSAPAVEVTLHQVVTRQGTVTVADVTDRAASDRLEADVRAARDELAQLADWVPHLRWSSNPDGTLAYVSNPLAAYTGKPVAQAPGEGWLDNVHPDDRGDIDECWARSVASGEPFDHEVRLRRHDGQYRWIANHAVAQRDTDGRVVGWHGTATDIHEARLARDRLVAERTRFSRLINSVPGVLCIFRLSPDGVTSLPYASGALAEYWALRPEEVRRDAALLFARMPPPDAARMRASMRESAAECGPWRVELRVRHPERGLLWIEARGTPEREPDGGTLWYGVLLDVTAHKQLELEVQHRREMLRLFVEHAPASIAMFDADLRFITASRRFLAQYGIGSDPAGRRLYELLPRVEQQWELMHERVLAGQSHGSDQEFVPDPDGTPRWVRWRAVPWLGTAGEVGGMILSTEDITAQKRAEDAQARSQKLEGLGTLAGGLAHDFNNILAAITGYAQLSMADLAPDHPVQRALQEIDRAAERAAQLVVQILSFSRPRDHDRQLLDVRAVVREAMELLRPNVPAAIDLVASLPDDLPSVLADSGQLHQVLTNLVTNSAQAIGTPAGQVRITLEAVTADERLRRDTPDLAPGAYVLLSVADNGPGMRPDVQERVFDPFFTTKPVGAGSGLGLSAVHGIVRAHGGVITVDSVPELGATFRIYLPAVRATAERRPPPGRQAGYPSDASSPGLPVPRRAPAQRGRAGRVLYVDDEPMLVEIAERVLTPLGYEVLGYTDPSAALRGFRKDPDRVDAVVTDMAMPGMSGVDLAAELLRDRPDLPVVLVSGHLTAEEQDEIRHAGVREILLKPSSTQALVRALERAHPPPLPAPRPPHQPPAPQHPAHRVDHGRDVVVEADPTTSRP